MLPLANPLQVTFVVAVMFAVTIVGSVIVTVVDAVQPLASVIVTV
jgi:hypothetical protein